MSNKNLLIIILLLFQLELCCQSEIKLYSGPYDRHGLAIEHLINDRLGIEIRGSFRTHKTSNFFINADVDNRENNIYVTGMIKRYKGKKYANAGFFYGLYLRYWQNFQTVIGMNDWTIEQRDYAENNDSWISTRTHKISLGLLTGYKFRINDKFYIDITTGLGFSPPFSYRKKVINYNSQKTGLYGEDAWYGYLNHMSLIGQLGLSYKFGSSKNKTATTDK